MDFIKNSISFVIVPLTLFCILYVLTSILVVERDILKPKPPVEVELTGVGLQVPKPLKIDSWHPYYGGGEGVDRVITTGHSALRVTTGGDGGWYGARADVSNLKFSNTAIVFSVRFHDWDEINRLMLLFSDGVEFANYYGINLKNYFSAPANGEWIEVVIERSEFEVIEGSPNWDNITDIAVRVIPVPGVSTRVWFDGFAVVPEMRTTGVVSMTFDDGFAAVATAQEIMSEYDMVGTAYIIPDWLGRDNYLTQTEVDHLADNGWDISGHSHLNLTEQLAPDVDTELAAVLEYLSLHSYTGREHFAYPNGAYNDSVQSQVLEYFVSGRTIDGFHQSPEYLYPYSVNAFTVSSSTPMTQIIDEIDVAIKTGSWLILVWHDFASNPASDVEYQTDDFDWVVEYLAEKKQEESVEVLPYSQAWARFSKS